MSQQYFIGGGNKTPQAQDDQRNVQALQSPGHQPFFVTVGSGSGSENTTLLQSLLNDDSGCGESNNVDDSLLSSSHISDSATLPDYSQARAIPQLWYNRHRLALARSISRVIDLLTHLQEVNAMWPAHYPSVQRTETAPRSSSTSDISNIPPRSSNILSPPPTRLSNLQRARTTFGEDADAESSKAAENRAATTEPRLVTPQISREFSILRLDLQLGASHHAELVHSLEKKSIASLLDGKVTLTIRHLLALQGRIEDTSSKVLVTGDLNAGKSTFCNALLRRKVLPEDEQPCTAIFCEVLDAGKNMGREEVHAVYKDAVYYLNDESTYDVVALEELGKIVTNNEAYAQCKIYINDGRPFDQSLLNNGVVDIALIDAPGLNSDTTMTTAIFARQEEIDVVVFVVAAANHFTLTAREFISSAAAEKDYFFIVVNGYDSVKDQERCQKLVLRQVQSLSPATSKEEAELVHFVSSNAIPTTPLPNHGSSGGGGGDDGDPGDYDHKGKGKDVEKIREFEHLEQSLRRFVLEKRARSKLAPAKTYLLNILNDVHDLATVNLEVARSACDRATSELQSLEPQLESGKKLCSEVRDEVTKTIEEISADIYDHTRMELNSSIANLRNAGHCIPYDGLFTAFKYAEALKNAMLSHIADSVTRCEEHARGQAVRGVNMVKQLGILHIGDEYQNLNFRPDVMFRRRRDTLARRVEIPIGLWNFIDWSILLQWQEKVAGTGMALTVAASFGSRVIGMHGGWMDHAFGFAKLLGNNHFSRLIVPGAILAAVVAVAYTFSQVPKSFPDHLSSKVSAHLRAIDYVHANASRISRSTHSVLCLPADNLRVALEQSVKNLDACRDKTLRIKSESETVLRYFGNLVDDSVKQRAVVEEIDLDAVQPETAS